ncbi:MAG TPA: response regulator transcription factor, partial [Caldithrix abyssi]|nr:response regulator transcription factor [Caldithrix abyssi]
ILGKEKYRVKRFLTGEDVIAAMQKEKPDLLLLDLMLPGIDGLDVCKSLKKDDDLKEVPIIMLTAKGEDADIVSGLELGADDYITKPFNSSVLLARIKAMLRRKSEKEVSETDIIRIFNIVIHPGRHTVTVDGKPVNLTYSEFRLLQFLARHPGWVYSRYQIVDALRGADYPVTERAIDVQVVGLRKKLGDAGKYIETVRAVGYRFRQVP